jgi:hypothetical protein
MSLESTSPPLHPRHGIHEPTSGTPARAPGSIRRTATTDMLRPDGPRGELVLVGRARDLATDASGAARVLGEASYEARVAYQESRKVTRIRTQPELANAQQLVGSRAMTGFRGALDAALPEERDAKSLLYLLLDDLPVATLVSGYAASFGNAQPMPKEVMRLHVHPDLCAGWRRGGTILSELEATQRVPQVTGPLAPPLARAGDSLAWHALPELPESAMRRHRRLDLTLGERLGVDVLFRDLHKAPGGRETIVHEYSVKAELDPATLVFTEIAATAHALPWLECNPAAASAERLRGKSVHSLRPDVRVEFTGTTTCTHLNDTLRSLEDIAALAASLRASGHLSRVE